MSACEAEKYWNGFCCCCCLPSQKLNGLSQYVQTCCFFLLLMCFLSLENLSFYCWWWWWWCSCSFVFNHVFLFELFVLFPRDLYVHTTEHIPSHTRAAHMHTYKLAHTQRDCMYDIPKFKSIMTEQQRSHRDATTRELEHPKQKRTLHTIKLLHFFLLLQFANSLISNRIFMSFSVQNGLEKINHRK